MGALGGLGFKDLGFRVQGLGFTVQGLGFGSGPDFSACSDSDVKAFGVWGFCHFQSFRVLGDRV